MERTLPKRYSLGEEICNAISHGLGALFSVVAMVTLIIMAIQADSLSYLLVGILYGTSLILLYTMSTLYHAITAPRAKEVFRIFDHCSIFLLIAGTYTPLTMITLADDNGIWLFALNWIVAIVGVVLNSISIEKFKKFSLICYVAMGWSIVFSAKALFENLQIEGILLLLLGGLCYTGGIVFYKKGKNHPYMHFVWHLFVLAGSVTQFITIAHYVY